MPGHGEAAPLVSLLILTCNRQEFLQLALAAAAAQDYAGAIEPVIVDDGPGARATPDPRAASPSTDRQRDWRARAGGEKVMRARIRGSRTQRSGRIGIMLADGEGQGGGDPRAVCGAAAATRAMVTNEEACMRAPVDALAARTRAFGVLSPARG